MVLVKILGAIDLVAAVVFLMLIFGASLPLQIMLFAAGLLFAKGLFIITGDILSVVDLFSALMILLSIFFTLPSILLWIPVFLLLAKGVVSFI